MRTSRIIGRHGVFVCRLRHDLPCVVQIVVLVLETGFRRIGVQSIYRGGGEEHYSNIVYHYFEGNDVARVNADQTAGDVQHFDLSGRRVSDSHRGLTITRMPDGRIVKRLR